MEIVIIVGFLIILFCMFVVEGIHTDSEDEAKKNKQPKLKRLTPEEEKERKTTLKGKIGEQIVKVAVLSKLNPRDYRYFHNLIVPTDNGTTQIDNIIVSRFGIFVVEAKYFQGWIYGKEREEKWTHTLSSYSKYSFQNPLRQNYKHIKALSRLLDIPEKQFHSIVVFTHRKCQIKTNLPENVCLIQNFIEYIQRNTEEIIHMDKCLNVCEILSRPDYVATPEREKEHIHILKQRHGLDYGLKGSSSKPFID